LQAVRRATGRFAQANQAKVATLCDTRALQIGWHTVCKELSACPMKALKADCDKNSF
jgi:hypothetical protein